MRFGINTFLFVSPFTTASAKLFPQFKKWGFDSIEIPVEDPSHIDPAKVKAAADKAGVVVGRVGTATVSGADVRRGKPAPDIFLKAAELCGVDAAAAVVIEDSKNGTLGAKAAGMRCVGYINPHSGNQDLTQADIRISSFAAPELRAFCGLMA
mgnify:CR=1 FL=1